MRLKFPSQHRCLMSGLCTVLHLRRPSTELCVAPGFRNSGLWPCTLEHTCSEYDTPLLFAAIVGLSVRAGHSITRHATDNVPVHIITYMSVFPLERLLCSCKEVLLTHAPVQHGTAATSRCTCPRMSVCVHAYAATQASGFIRIQC